MMFSRRTDPIGDAVILMVSSGALAFDPSGMAINLAGAAAHDLIKKVASQPPASVAAMGDALAIVARQLFAATADYPPNANILYGQMVEAGLLCPAEIVDAGMEPNAVCEAMLAKVTDREHLMQPMQDLFRAITIPVMARLLVDHAFANDLTPAYMREMLRRVAELDNKLESLNADFGGFSEALEALGRVPRDQMEALASRFEIERCYELSDAQLREALEKKAEEYREYRARIDGIDERTAGLGPLKAAAREAASQLEFDRVEALLAQVDYVETEISAETKVLRADNALLRGRTEEAFRLLSAAADSFGGDGPVEPARRRLDYAIRLARYGDRFGGSGRALAIAMIRRSLDDLVGFDIPQLRAAGQNDLAANLAVEGDRLGGGVGEEMLAEAIGAYRIAIEIWVDPSEETKWAIAKSNLGNALRTLGAWRGGEQGIDLLTEAIEAHNAALRVWTEQEHPEGWAKTQVNLGVAMVGRAKLLRGPVERFDEAITAYRAALRVWTVASFPTEWASTQYNLGVSLALKGEQSVDAEGNAHLRDAVESYRAALQVLTEQSHPLDWAMAQNDLGAALAEQGERIPGEAGVELLLLAIEAHQAALRVQADGVHPLGWAMNMGNLGLAQEALAAKKDGGDRCDALRAASAAFEDLLRFYEPEHMPYDRARAAAALARVREKLARHCA